MTAIDLHGDILTSYHGNDLLVVIPLTDDVTEMWCRRYEALAQARELPAHVLKPDDEPALLHVTIPVRSQREDVLKMLDAARSLIAETEAAEQSPDASNPPEGFVREGWATQQT